MSQLATAFPAVLSDKTPLAVVDKIKFMTHVNEEHQDELALFIEAFTNDSVADDRVAQVADVYTDGLLLISQSITAPLITSASSPAATAQPEDCADSDEEDAIEQYFIAFENEIAGDITLKSQYILLLQSASKKLGKLAIKLQDRQFTVTDSYYASPSLYRMVVTASADTPLHHPGYAYLFDVYADLTDENAASIAKSKGDKLQRYYTLRKAWQDAQTQQVHAWVDAYIHGDTPGGDWALRQQAGMTLNSVRDYPEKIAHLSAGQCLLICDETSLPTVANLLETWQNPIAPVVIAVTNNPEDLAYLHAAELSEHLLQSQGFQADNIIAIANTPELDLTNTVMRLLDTHPALANLTIEKVWGALEAQDAKTLRRQLKTALQLSRQDLVLKVYWRAQ
jgi:NADPH-dependent ferric siderophore reductase